MATQTGSIDLKAHYDAGKVAANYVSDISNGILVHPENDTQNGVRITDMVDILRDDVSVMAVGERNLETGNDVIRIGKGGETRTEIDFHSLKLIDKEGTSYVWFSDLRDAEGYVPEKFIGDGETTQFYITVLPKTVIEVTIDGTPTAAYTRSGRLFTFTTAPASDSEIIIKYELYSTNIAEAKAYTLGLRKANSPIGAVSMAEGVNTIASGAYSHVEGRASKAIGYYSHAEGHNTTAQNESCHAEGYSTFASSSRVQDGAAHAEGYETQAKALAGHAEGYRTIAGDGGLTNIGCHAEGANTQAYLIGAHAEGRGSIANERGAHAQNEYTIASKEAQTALGTYNLEDTSTTTTHPSSASAYGQYAFIVGNGTDDNDRSNALTVDWQGNVDASGDVTVSNHSSPIGTVKYASLTSNKSVPNNTGTELVRINLDKGVWVIVAGVRWATNANGYRQMNVYGVSGSTEIHLLTAPVSGHYTQMNFSRILEVSADNTPIYLNGRQTSGGALNALAGGGNWGTYITAVRIA